MTSPSPHSGAHPGILAWLVLAISLALTGLVWHQLHATVVREAQQDFHHRAEEIEAVVRDRLSGYRLLLQGGAGLFAASQHVSRQEWRDYVAALNLSVNYPGVQGLGYAPHLTAAQREAHVRAVRAEGFPGYEVWPAGERAEYAAIAYLEPFTPRNQRAFGFDMYSEATRHAAMERARDSGLPSISGKVRLMLEGPREQQAGFLMYAPFYGPHAHPDSRGRRHDALVGWIYAPFRMEDLMAGILGSGDGADVDIEIFDGETPSPENRLYDADKTDHLFRKDGPVPFVHTDINLDFGGRIWSVHLYSLPRFEARIDWQKPRYALAAGLIISLLLFAFTRNLTRTRARAVELAGDMTRALAESEYRYRQMFEANQAVKLVIDPADGRIVDANPAAAIYYGYPLEQLRAMHIFDINIMPQADLAAEMATATAKRRLYFNFKHRLADGQVRDVEVFTGPVLEAGRTLLYSVIHDVTARNQALAQQRAILDNAMVGIMHLRGRHFVWANAKAEQMLGRGNQELRERSTRLMYADPADFEAVGGEGYAALARGEDYQTERRLRRKDGSIFWAYLSGKLVDPADADGVSIWILLDVSETREAQAALAARTQELLETNHSLELMARMTNILQSCDTLEQAYPVIFSHVPRLLPGSAGALYIMENEESGAPPHVRWGDMPPDAEDGRACWAHQAHRMQLFAAEDAPRCPLAPAGRATLCLPLSTQGKRLGVLVVVMASEASETKAQRHQLLAESIAERLTMSLSSLILRKQLRDQTLHDPLTGLYNRRYLNDMLEREVQLALRKDRSLAVIMLDIDHFKRFNDRHGHLAGDQVLQTVGQELARLVRDTDTACRYGGEEFLLLMPETGVDTALERAESLRRRVHELALKHQDRPLGAITISLGVAVLPVHGLTGDRLIAAADAALYQAKAAGRNRSVVYGTPAQP